MAGCNSIDDLARILKSTYIMVKPFSVKDENLVNLGGLLTISAETFMTFFQLFGVEKCGSDEVMKEDKAISADVNRCDCCCHLGVHSRKGDRNSLSWKQPAAVTCQVETQTHNSLSTCDVKTQTHLIQRVPASIQVSLQVPCVTTSSQTDELGSTDEIELFASAGELQVVEVNHVKCQTFLPQTIAACQASVKQSTASCQTRMPGATVSCQTSQARNDVSCQTSQARNNVACQTAVIDAGVKPCLRQLTRKRRFAESGLATQNSVAMQADLLPGNHTSRRVTATESRGVQTLWQPLSNSEPKLGYRQDQGAKRPKTEPAVISTTGPTTRSSHPNGTLVTFPQADPAARATVMEHRVCCDPDESETLDNPSCMSKTRNGGRNADDATGRCYSEDDLRQVLDSVPENSRLMMLDFYLDVHNDDLLRSPPIRYTMAHIIALHDFILCAQGSLVAIQELIRQRVRHLMEILSKFIEKPTQCKEIIAFDQSVLSCMRSSRTTISLSEAAKCSEPAKLEQEFLLDKKPDPLPVRNDSDSQRFEKKEKIDSGKIHSSKLQPKPERNLRSSSRVATQQWSRRPGGQTSERSRSSSCRRKASLLDSKGRLRSYDPYKI